MTSEKMCGVCGKDVAVTKCSVCGIDLCKACVKEVIIEQVSPGSTHKGLTTSTSRPAIVRKEVCEKCLKEADFL